MNSFTSFLIDVFVTTKMGFTNDFVILFHALSNMPFMVFMSNSDFSYIVGFFLLEKKR